MIFLGKVRVTAYSCSPYGELLLRSHGLQLLQSLRITTAATVS